MSDWDGAGYAHISALQRAMATDAVATVPVAGTERVLDVGCGDGYVTRLLAAWVPAGSVLGLDPSPRMIETARTADDQLTNVAFQLGDVTTMTFTGEFDLVVSFNALHWVHDQTRAYRHLAAALAPGGRVLVQYVCDGPRPSIEDIATTVTTEPPWSAFFPDFPRPYLHIDPTTLPALAAAAGLAVVAQSVTDRTWDFGSREAFTRWCTVGFTDWTAHLPAPEIPTFVAEVVHRYETVTATPGLFHFLQLRAELSCPTPE
ncbi:class I SAM-dependent methyltransferase [Nocardia sp. AG03]|uniref:class I SAM-dependent methyltransferase n=1 Tax=Nocardia sp. AG03 TaxID=3025312 RepID=UPI0024188619|nr:class I SAM-dependent methyltransferase [Nocardia sp. AG03]